MALGLRIVALLAAAGAAASTEAPVEKISDVVEALASGDEVCTGTDGPCTEEGTLSLRQLRAVARHDGAPEAEGILDYTQGMPGGWGEAAETAAKIDLSNVTLPEAKQAMPNIQMEPALQKGHHHRTGSCAAMGCANYFVSGSPCQCSADCWANYNCCGDYLGNCFHGKNIMVLYHQTSPEAGPLILQYGFRPGKSGWCGGGIYFATNPDATNKKAIGPDSHKGFIIEAIVDVGKVYRPQQCDFQQTGPGLWKMGYDSISYNPGDGDEYVIYTDNQPENGVHVLATRKFR